LLLPEPFTPDPGPQVIDLLSPTLSFAGGFLTALLAEPLRQKWFAPKLKLSFGTGPDFISHTPEAQGVLMGEATYVRVRAINRSFRIAKACRAYLTGVFREDAQGHLIKTQYCDSIQLSWAVRGEQAYGPQDLARGVPYFFDLVSFRDGTDVFVPHVQGLPFRYQDIFRTRGTYHFDVIVAGDGVKPAKMRVRIAWGGDRQALAASHAG